MCVSVCECASVSFCNWFYNLIHGLQKQIFFFLSGNLDFGLEKSWKSHGTFFWDFCGNFSKSQLCRKCFHVMTSSCFGDNSQPVSFLCWWWSSLMLYFAINPQEKCMSCFHYARTDNTTYQSSRKMYVIVVLCKKKWCYVIAWNNLCYCINCEMQILCGVW